MIIDDRYLWIPTKSRLFRFDVTNNLTYQRFKYPIKSDIDGIPSAVCAHMTYKTEIVIVNRITNSKFDLYIFRTFFVKLCKAIAV